MTTYEEYNLIVRGLPPAAAAIFDLMWKEPLAPQASARLLNLVRLMLNGSAAQWEKVRRALILLARLGKLAPRTLGPVIGSIEAELAAAAAGSGGGAASGGAAAGGAAAGVGLATILAGLAMVLAIAYAFWSIGSEILKEIELPKDGKSCGLDTDAGKQMALDMRKTWARGVGQKTALQNAIDKANGLCGEDAAKCTGKCKSGKCRPAASIQEVDIRWRGLWTTVYVHYTCPCGCVAD